MAHGTTRRQECRRLRSKPWPPRFPDLLEGPITSARRSAWQARERVRRSSLRYLPNFLPALVPKDDPIPAAGPRRLPLVEGEFRRETPRTPLWPAVSSPRYAVPGNESQVGFTSGSCRTRRFDLAVERPNRRRRDNRNLSRMRRGTQILAPSILPRSQPREAALQTEVSRNLRAHVLRVEGMGIRTRTCHGSRRGAHRKSEVGGLGGVAADTPQERHPHRGPGPKAGITPRVELGPRILGRVARPRCIGESRYVRKPRAMFASAATEGSYDREEQLAAAKTRPTRRTR
jgi:hypothetical protein